MARLKSPYDNDSETRQERYRRKMLNSDTVKYTMNMPRHIHKKVKRKALYEGKSIKDIIMENLLKYIEKE